MDFSFPKKEKLKSKKTIELLFSEGSSVSAYPLKLIYIQTQLPENVKIQAGVAVPKKSFKSAVKRNRIKRLVRESYRLNKHMVFNNIEGNFAFLFLYIGKELPLYDEIDKRMIHILQKFLTEENDAKID
ncbi:MAG: ribonuclease P protein component [Bacteroidota bacterium]